MKYKNSNHKIHYPLQQDNEKAYTACGKVIDPVYASAKIKDLTCNRCKKSVGG